MGRKKIQTLGESLDGLIQQLGIGAKINQFRVIEKWSEIVGENISKVTKPERVVDKVLYIKVSSMSWRTELLFHKPGILEKIEETIGKDIILDIRFH
ncbi:MAG: DUF721 domain-containing protein [Calditrichaeota bacterium]|nr:DUF721 domain-containing protein [Calditrichota bacterium]